MEEIKAESLTITPSPGQSEKMGIKKVNLQFSDIHELNYNLSIGYEHQGGS